MNSVLKQHIWSQIETDEPRQRIVLLGASNVKRSFPLAVEVAWQTWREPLAFEVAMGHGRSYGQQAGCFGKFFSGISECKIWDALSAQKPLPTFAVLTDIGNDLAYGVPIETIVEWVRSCLTRLRELNSQMLIGALPITTLEALSEVKYGVLRRLLVPSCRLSLQELLSRAKRLDDRLCELGEEEKTPVFPVQSEFYGFDPIHPRRCHYRAIWREVFSHFSFSADAESFPVSSWLMRRYLGQLSSPATWRGGYRARELPFRVRLHQGSTIALY